MTNSDLIDTIWRQIEPTVYITRADFERSLDGWEITPEEVNGQLAFVTLVRGPEFHFMSFGDVPISFRRGRSWLQPILDREGYVMTRTPKDAARQRRFNEKVGFVAVGEDEFMIHYRMDKRCPS